MSVPPPDGGRVLRAAAATAERVSEPAESRPSAVRAGVEEHDLLEEVVGRLLALLGEDPSREGLRRTPERVARSLRALTEGYGQTPWDVVGEGVFEEPHDGLVVVRDIPFHSLCEHHLLPFHGRAHVGYLPSGRVVGLSKVARLVELFARRLQVQERLTDQVADALEEVLAPAGVVVSIEAEHMCMTMRGVQKPGARTLTRAWRGRFREDPELREEWLTLIGRG